MEPLHIKTIILLLFISMNGILYSADSLNSKSIPDRYFANGSFLIVRNVNKPVTINLYAQISINAIVNEYIYSFRWSIIARHREEEMRDFGFLFGKAMKLSDNTLFSYSAGPAITGYGKIDYDRFISNNLTTIGLIYDLHIFYSYYYVGIGFKLFGNFNTKNSVHGFGITLNLGKLY